MSQSTQAVAGSGTTQVINGVTFFTSTAGKAIALFPRIPRAQYNWVLALAKPEAKVAEKLAKESPERVIAFRYDIQRMLADERKVTCYEQVKAAKQAGASFLYRRALTHLQALANQVLLAANVEVGEDALLGVPAAAGTATAYDEAEEARLDEEHAGDLDEAFAELVPTSVREY